MPNNLALSCEQAMSVFFCHRLKRILGDASSQYCPCGESRHHSVATKITNLNLFPAGSVSGGGGSMGLTGVSSGRGRGVHSLPGVSHLGNEPVGVVGGVGGRLDPAAGQGNGERASDIAGSVLGLGLSEVGLTVVVGHAIFIGVRLGDLLHDDGGGRVLGGGDGHKGKGRYQLHHLGTGDLTPRWVCWFASMSFFLYIVYELLVGLAAA